MNHLGALRGRDRLFLEQGEVVFGGVRELLGEQFDRLSALEQGVFSWLAILREQVLRGHTQCISDVAWSRAGGMLASSSDYQTVRVWNMRTGACIRILRGHSDLVNGIAWHLGGNRLASS